MRNKDFIIFILSNGRANKILTIKTLERYGYTGQYKIIIDDDDETSDEYYELFGDKVIMFSKEEISETFDECDNFKDRRSIVYARNACFQIAKDLGIKYFMQLDDDYRGFEYRFTTNIKLSTGPQYLKSIDGVLDAYLDFYKTTNFKSIAMSQGGDFIGGSDGFLSSLTRRRKCMNTFFCSTDREFKFIGRINEDVNTYTRYGSIGKLFLTIPNIGIKQSITQQTSGGMSNIYEDNGTYIKSFYSVIVQPSSVKVSMLSGNSGNRLHHRVDWKKTTPMIISEKYKK